MKIHELRAALDKYPDDTEIHLLQESGLILEFEWIAVNFKTIETAHGIVIAPLYVYSPRVCEIIEKQKGLV